ncbi:MAG: phosphatidylserine decarboxylase family protein [Pedosphaera parvula]|nr:phosphatidylserine decarboxylase family protein [Pedosphaera parvula]
MNNSGKAGQAAVRIILLSFLVLLAVWAVGIVAYYLHAFITTIAGTLAALWALFVIFTLYVFRDPTPKVPADPNAIVAPAHGKVDVIDEVEEPEFIGGRCRRISIFLSVFDVHVQQAPVAGKIVLLKHTPGLFLNALNTDSAEHNENVLIGIQSSEKAREKIGVRLIAGLIARRILPWVAVANEVARGERLSLIQFGSRVNLYLPLAAKVVVKLGDKVVGGETILATRN